MEVSSKKDEYIRSVEDFDKFLLAHRDEILSKVVDINDLPDDDEWFNEDEWDEIYERTVLKK